MKIRIAFMIIIALNSITGYGQKTPLSTWSHFVFENKLVLDFGEKKFFVDTFDYVEGLVFYFNSEKDSSYLRINYNSLTAEFECCKHTDKYIENSINKNDFFFDRKGKINGKELFWREIKNDHITVVFNNCPPESIAYYNNIINIFCRYFTHWK